MKKRKSLFSRGFFFKSLLSLILFLYLNIFSIPQAHALTSVDACARDPVCVKSGIIKFGGKEALKKSSIDLTKKTITKTTVNLTKGTTAKTTVKSLGTKGLLYTTGAYIADKVLGHLIDDGIDVVQQKIADYFFEDKGGGLCTYRVRLLFESGQYSPYVEHTGLPNLTVQQDGRYYDLYDGGGGFIRRLNLSYDRGAVADIVYERLDYTCQPALWDDLTDAEKDEAIDKWIEDNPLEAWEDLIELTPIEVPSYEPGDELFFDDDDGGLKETVPDGESHENPDDTTPDCENPDAPNYDPDHADCQPDPEPTDCPAEDSPDYDPNDPNCVEEEEEEEVECVECDNFNFTDKNFFEYAKQKFIDDPKFPFDIFGDIPSAGTENQCPTVELYDMSKELCFINDSIATLKYPVWIAWMFKLVFHI